MKKQGKTELLEIILLFMVLLSYICNKMFFREYIQHWFVRNYWNDVLAGICLAILSEWLTRFWMKKTISNITLFYIVLGAGMYWEYVAPLYISYSVSDVKDIVAYVSGSIFYIVFRKILYRGGNRMYCSQCGSEVEEGTKFCSSCGAKLESIEELKNDEKSEPVVTEKETKQSEKINGNEEPRRMNSPGTEEPQQSNHTIELPKSAKKSTTKKLVFGIAGGIIVLFLIIGIFSGGGSTELYDYLPLARADVEEFLSNENFESDAHSEWMYGKEDNLITLNERGNIDIIVITTPGYTLCGVEVGDNFDVLEDSRKFSDKGYTYLAESDLGQIIYGLPDGEENLGGDQLIGLTLDDKQTVTEITFSRTGARDLVKSMEEMSSELESADEEELETTMAEETIYRIGEPVRTDFLEFTLDYVYSFDEILNGETIHYPPEGAVYVVVEYHYTNISNQMVDDLPRVRLIDEKGAVYTEDSKADGYFKDYSESISLSDLAPELTFTDAGIYLMSKSVWDKGNLKVQVEDWESHQEVEILVDSGVEEAQEFAGVPEETGEYILPESSTRYLTFDDIYGLTKVELRLARNEIYARHGRSFQTEDLNAYFSSKAWYNGYLSAEEFDDSVLNEYEKANLDLIKQMEDSTYGEGTVTMEIQDVVNVLYSANNSEITMEIGEYSGNGQVYIVFFEADQELWRGELYSAQNTASGGLLLTFSGQDIMFRTYDSLTVEWFGMESVDFPSVYYENDIYGIYDTYSYSKMLNGN